MAGLEILQTRLFKKQKKKLMNNQIKELDISVRKFIENPDIGQRKTGNLSDIWVYKFFIFKQQFLLAYKWDEESRTLMAIAVHENFYRDLKKNLK